MLDADGGRNSAVTARVRSAWKNFREFSYFNWKRILVKTEKQSMCYLFEELSDAWQWGLHYADFLSLHSFVHPMKVEHELKMNRTEMSMIRWMCGIKLNDRKKSGDLRELLRLEPISTQLVLLHLFHGGLFSKKASLKKPARYQESYMGTANPQKFQVQKIHHVGILVSAETNW